MTSTASRPPQLELLREPADLRSELAGPELLVWQERRRWIAEDPDPHGDSVALLALGRKPR